MQEPKTSPSPLGQVLKDYRKSHSNLTQEQLAYILHVEPRTLRAWENERPLGNIRELRRIADLLGIEPERLGLAASVYIPRTPEQIEEVVKRVWSLVEESHIQEAHMIIERLIQNLEPQITTEDSRLLSSLARAHHTAGYVISEGTKANESLEAVLQADTAARGNGIQLLGRAYLRKKNLDGFERAMAEAEELATTFDPATSSTQGHYSLGTVYEEYGRSYADLGQIPKAMEYLDRAKVALPSAKFWELLIKTARATALVKGGELQSGVQLAIETAIECQATGAIRYLDRIYVLEQYIAKKEQELARTRRPLHEVLYGEQVTEL